MPKDLPGFYFDSEKNRYFPLNSSKPVSANKPSASSSQAVSDTPLDRSSRWKLAGFKSSEPETLEFFTIPCESTQVPCESKCLCGPQK
ncbi:hypothetical protein BT96DRAFT_169210 [Gymnopus androsaceus JB14]|uniref:Uncharacterized protein n=1 Tax=Gymnopus androsaceus JB14 TaxID=1447944 RepID=A0A6A4H9E8_9AGAR|nr:hypothetical protein BT96DRAFT_169210 [Gymnopus androsaceus JB14]